MPGQSQILVVGSRTLGSEVERRLTPPARYRVRHIPAISIGSFLQDHSPDLAFIGGQELEGGVAQAVRDFGRFQKKFPLILIDPELPLSATVPGVATVMPKLQASGPLDSLVNVLLYAFGHQQPLRTRGVPFGVVEELVMPGEHVALMQYDDDDLGQAASFWKVADAADDFVFIGSRTAISLYKTRFAWQGLDFGKLEKAGRLTIVKAEEGNAAMVEQLTGCVMRSLKRGAQLLRIIGTVSGWAPKKISQTTICEHLLTTVVGGLPTILLCPYRVKAFDASSLLVQALETHPVVISRNRLLRNSMAEHSF